MNLARTPHLGCAWHNGMSPQPQADLLIAHESIESFLGEMEGSNSAELVRQRERSTREFRDGLVVSWEQVKLNNGL